MTTRSPIGSSNLETAPLVLGGNVFGWTADRDTSFAVLDAFLEAGGNLIDTADGYSHWAPGHRGGESEMVIGEWLAARGARDRVLIATKVSTHPDFQGLAPENVKAAAEASLRRLGVETIDLYYAHYDDDAVPLEHTARAFSELVDAGAVRTIGLSNYSADRVAGWMRIAREEGLHAPVALQPHYNLVERDFERNGLRDVAEQENLAVFPYFSLAKGFLTGKYRDAFDAQSPQASPRAAGASEYLDARGMAVLTALDALAEARGEQLATIALAWLRQQPGVTAPIASARAAHQLPALLDSMWLELTGEEIASLSGAFDER